MRKLLTLALFLPIAFSCRKNEGGGNPVPPPDPDYTPVPPPATITTQINAYITNEQGVPIPGPSLFHVVNSNGSPLSWPIMTNGKVSTGTIVADRFLTRTRVEIGVWGYTDRMLTMPLSASIRNYARIKIKENIFIGGVSNAAPSLIAIPGGGTIAFGTNSIYHTPTQIYPGYFGPEITAEIYSTYLNPQQNDFAAMLPAYLAADVNNERSYLKSFGGITMDLIPTSSTGSGYLDFYNGATAELKLPIPPAMLSNAPDTVTSWYQKNDTWTKGGWAVRQGNFYVGRIGKVANWTFAIPVKGVYSTIQVRADSATVTNTAVRIKSGSRIIAESRTDADGNAIVFVPTHEALTAEVLPNEESFSPDIYSYSIGTFTKSSTVTVKLPGTNIYLGTLTGKVYNCNGDPVMNGVATVRIDVLDKEYVVPVKNGRFSSAFWLYGTNNGASVRILDHATGQEGDFTNVVLFAGDTHKMNFSTCQNATYLYCNYTIDGTPYEIRDNANAPTVYLVATKATPFAQPTIKTNTSNNFGVNFNAWPEILGYWPSTISEIVINGEAKTFDNTKEAHVMYSRFDGVINGYIEGWFSFYYRDNGNVSRHARGNFRVKRTY